MRKAKVVKDLPKGQTAWDIIVPLGMEEGKYKQKWTRFYGTRKEAEEKLVELTGEVHRGEFVRPSEKTVSDWLDWWLKMSIQSRCAPNTYISYSSVIENYLKPKLGQLRLQQLTPLHVEHYYAERRAQGLSDRTVTQHHTILSGSLKAAVKQKLLRENVASMAMNKPRTRMRSSGGVLANVWTSDEARRFLNTLKQEGNAQTTALFALALDTGIRKGELLGLMWKDLDGKVLQVERQLLGREEDEAGVLHLKTSLPKTQEARSVTVSEVTIALLREHRREQAELKLKNRKR